MKPCHTVALCVGVAKSIPSSSSEWSSELSRRADVAKGDPKLGTIATRIRAKQSATWGLGAQARAGLWPSSSSISKLAPLAISSWTTGTRPFRADKCKGLLKQNRGSRFEILSLCKNGTCLICYAAYDRGRTRCSTYPPPTINNSKGTKQSKGTLRLGHWSKSTWSHCKYSYALFAVNPVLRLTDIQTTWH